MLNGVNLNYIVVLLVTGSVLLAAVYHTILFLHRRNQLMGSYSIYLWSTFAYCFFRTIVFYHDPEVYKYLNPDEILQMISFVMYIRFASLAMDLEKSKDRFAILFAELTPYVIGFYLLLNTVVVNTSENIPAYVTLKVIARTYLLLLGFLMLLIVIRRRRSVFYRYLAAGAICMIICGFVSSILSLMNTETFMFGAISWLMFGFFTDVVFFSSAVGYRIRQEYREREESLKQLLRKEAELQQKEMEKFKVVFETREEERMRIARDLHDDMGSTLSSIGIYTRVVAGYMDTDKEKANEYLDKIQDNAKLLMENTTDLIWALQTNYGEMESIFRRMQRTAIEMLSSSNITPHIHIASPENLPLLHINAQKNCWLIFKEALNNVCKYSKAANCYISIKKELDLLVISITDDGVGFENPTQGNGLSNMRSRATDLQGEFIIERTPGRGTVSKAAFPMNHISMTVINTHE